MFRRLLQPRWLALMALMLAGGLMLAWHLGVPGRVTAEPPSVPADRRHKVDVGTEKLHNRTAARTKEEDPDDLPPAVSPEQAAQTAVQYVRGRNAPAVVNGQRGGDERRSLGTKHEGSTAVFSVVVDGTEVEVDRVTGKVVGTHKVSP